MTGSTASALSWVRPDPWRAAPSTPLYYLRRPAPHRQPDGAIGERLNQTDQSGFEGAGSSAGASLGEPATLSALRVKLLRFATLQLGDPHLAEDAVQEALLGALSNLRSFRGEAALNTWVFSILKNKIADQLRQRTRRPEVSENFEGNDPEETLSAFDERGMWKASNRPAAWADPESALADHQFWRVFEACLEHLPGQQGRLFMMREFVQLETEEICQALSIKPGNLNVALHRARLKLRDCLQQHWFVAGEQSC